MSDEEEYEEEEIEEEEEVEEEAQGEEPAAPEPPTAAAQEARRASKISAKDEDQAPQEERKLRPPPPRDEVVEEKEMTEAEAAIAAARKRKEEEDAHKLLDYEQQRKIEKEKIDEELRELREKQQRRRAERDQEQREYAERMKQDEERRRQEEDAHKQQIEAEKRRRDEEKQKRQQMIAGSLLGAVGTGEGANYVVQKGSGLPGQPEGEGKSKRKGPTAEQIAAAKKQYIEIISRKPNIGDMLPNDLKTLIKRLHQRIERIIGETYDLQTRSGRQEYDLKELHDRQLQAQRNKALSMGIDPAEAGDLKHPPKVHVASKFDRQTDRRSYVDKKDLFEKPPQTPVPKIAHGTARPPTEWGRKKGTGVMDEIEQIRKNLEPPKYVEQAPVEGDAAKPPVSAIPLTIPDEEYEAEAPPAARKESAAARKESAAAEPQEVEAEA